MFGGILHRTIANQTGASFREEPKKKKKKKAKKKKK